MTRTTGVTPSRLWRFPARKSRIFAEFFLSGIALCPAKAADASPQSYSPAAFVQSTPSAESPSLIVYPLDRKEYTIPLPASPPLVRVVSGPDGHSWYATTSAERGVGNDSGFAKIDFGPTRVNKIVSSLNFESVVSFAVSAQQDRIVVSGTRSEGGRQTCGLFELRVPGGELRPLLLSADCHCGSPWSDLSLSPNGARAFVHRRCLDGFKDRPEFIDLLSKTTSLPGEDFWKAAFSPDGKWIAALEDGPNGISKTVLIDAKDSSRRRDLGGTSDVEIVWSPDSRYILHVEQRSCPWQHPLSLEIISIETGRRSIVPNSKCKVPTHFIGWIGGNLGK